MTVGHLYNSLALAEKEWLHGNEECPDRLVYESRKGLIKVAFVADRNDQQFLPVRGGSLPRFFRHRLSVRELRIHKQATCRAPWTGYGRATSCSWSHSAR